MARSNKISERLDYDVIEEVPWITSVTHNPLEVTTYANETPPNGTSMNYYFYQVRDLFNVESDTFYSFGLSLHQENVFLVKCILQ